MFIPSKNSNAANTTPKKRDKGDKNPIPKTEKYSSNLIADPVGSIAFTKPEKIKVAPTINREAITSSHKIRFRTDESLFPFYSPYSNFINPKRE